MLQHGHVLPSLVVLDEQVEVLNVLELDELEGNQLVTRQLGRGHLQVLGKENYV
jgi:hypothetical protein